MFTATASATYSATSSGTGSGSGNTEPEAVYAASFAATTAAQDALTTTLYDTSLIEFSLSNTRLDFSNNIVNETYSFEPTGRWYSVCMSSDSKYQMALQINKSVYNSSDYGITWDIVTSINNDGYYSCRMSYDGKYRIISSTIDYNVYISSDYGITWNKVNIINLSDVNVGVSGDGKYMTFVTYFDSDAGGKVWRSSDYGTTWSDVTPTFPDHPGFYYWVAISQDGMRQTLTITASSTSTGIDYTSSIVTSSDFGVTWNLIPLGINICSNAMSYDGKYQIAGDFGTINGIYTSKDYGVTWKSYDVEISDWFCGAVSQDGKYQIYVSSTASLSILSSNDYGNTWTKGNFNKRLLSVAMSANGQNLTIVPRNLKLYNSTDYGVTWTDNNNSEIYKAILNVSSSSSGQYQSASITNSNIIKSSDYGVSWNNTGDIDSWTSISISLTGQYQSAISQTNISISSDFGNSWKNIPRLNVNNTASITVSASGQFQTYCESPGNIYTSSDYGNTWNKVDTIYGYFSNVAMSSSGKYQATADYLGPKFAGGSIYISNNYGKDWKIVSSTENRLWNCISCSSNGKYFLAGTNYNGYALSSDYGNSWTIIVESTKTKYSTCQVSSTGQYQFIKHDDTNQMYYSTDYGNTWSLLFDEYTYQIGGLSSTANNQVYYKLNSIMEVYTKVYNGPLSK